MAEAKQRALSSELRSGLLKLKLEGAAEDTATMRTRERAAMDAARASEAEAAAAHEEASLACV